MVLDNVVSGDYTFDGWTDEIILSTYNRNVGGMLSYQRVSLTLTDPLLLYISCACFALVLSLSLCSAESATPLIIRTASLVSAPSLGTRPRTPPSEEARRKQSHFP